jgi:DNA-binding Lrp family transcriptional regulator
MRMTGEIDEIDARILRTLLVDARTSFVDIAKETKLSTVSIGDRFAQLEKNGVITGSTIHICYPAVKHNVVCSVLIKVEKKEIDQVLSYIQKISAEKPILLRDPKNDIILIVGLTDLRQVAELKEKIRRNKYVLDLRVETWIGVRNMPENLTLSANTKPSELHLKPAIYKTDLVLDNLDLDLIERLTKDSMQPFSKLAKEMGTSINTVSKKYRRLVDNHIIRAVIRINLKKLGYHAMLFFALSFASESETDSVIKALMEIKDTFLITKTSGNYDLMAQMFVRDIDQLLATQFQVANIAGIANIESLVYPLPPAWPMPGENISTF